MCMGRWACRMGVLGRGGWLHLHPLSVPAGLPCNAGALLAPAGGASATTHRARAHIPARPTPRAEPCLDDRPTRGSQMAATALTAIGGGASLLRTTSGGSMVHRTTTGERQELEKLREEAWEAWSPRRWAHRSLAAARRPAPGRAQLLHTGTGRAAGTPPAGPHLGPCLAQPASRGPRRAACRLTRPCRRPLQARGPRAAATQAAAGARACWPGPTGGLCAAGGFPHRLHQLPHAPGDA